MVAVLGQLLFRNWIAFETAAIANPREISQTDLTIPHILFGYGNCCGIIHRGTAVIERCPELC